MPLRARHDPGLLHGRRGVACCTVSLTITSSCVAPADPAAAYDTNWDRRPIVQFNPLPAGVVYDVWRAGDAAPLGTVSAVGQNYFRPARAIDAGAAPPDSAATLYVRACRSGERTCCTTSATSTGRLVQACSAHATPTPTNVVFSEYLINGDGGTCPGPSCEAGEAIGITKLSNCPVTLDGYHFAYLNAGAGSLRWMDFTVADVVPPRGVYVAIRNQAATTARSLSSGPTTRPSSGSGSHGSRCRAPPWITGGSTTL
jgi:hypothetical protein